MFSDIFKSMRTHYIQNKCIVFINLSNQSCSDKFVSILNLHPFSMHCPFKEKMR